MYGMSDSAAHPNSNMGEKKMIKNNFLNIFYSLVKSHSYSKQTNVTTVLCKYLRIPIRGSLIYIGVLFLQRNVNGF